MPDLVTRALDGTTWPDFAELVERHGGVWGGCWCLAFHPPRGGGPYTAQDNRRHKERLVLSGKTHAALVYDGGNCIGWCQFGPPPELPRIKFRRAYEAGAGALPDWRITCFFVDRAHRGRGVAAAALQAALVEIARLGGGVVESSPEEATGRKVSAGFLHNATLSLFERHGFERVRPLAMRHWLVRRVVPGAPPSGAPAGAG